MDDTPDNSQPADVHHKIGLLTRQLHDSLNELGYADKLRGSMGELPDAQSRLSYIARLTGEAAEKVLNRVEQAKAQHDYIAAETRRVVNSLVADPVAAVVRPRGRARLGRTDRAHHPVAVAVDHAQHPAGDALALYRRVQRRESAVENRGETHALSSTRTR